MKRLQKSGSSVISPARSEGELKNVLGRLGAADAFDDAAVHDLHFRIGTISGAWMANEESKEASSVAKALRATGKNLIDAAEILSGHESGFRATTEIQATSLAAKFLALDPTLDRDPKELISAFGQDAARIGHACLVAYADLTQKPGKDGRDALVWYDDFTALLLQIARKAHVAPTFGNDWVNDTPCGWLFNAAREFESFLYPSMRSPSVVACGKRLVRSLKRLGQVQGQNPRSDA